jgi:ankyrin repeat protein
MEDAVDEATKLLFDAVRIGDADEVRAVIRAGANLNAKEDEQGNTPLHCAALFTKHSVIFELLQNGADRTIKNARGQTAEEVMQENVKRLFSIPEQQRHASRVDGERKDKGPRQPGG